MFKILKVFGLSVVSAGVCLLGGVADAATGRAAYENVRTGSFAGAAQGASTQRMPSMPTLPLIAVGNISTDVPVVPGGGNDHDDPNYRPDECWRNVPHAIAGHMRNEALICEITECEHGWRVDSSRTKCVSGVECPDGGERNSTYTIDDCMRDVLVCVNNGALPNGLNDMFNTDLRASIINGMGLCYNQVDKCITDVRRNCERVYGSRADVWIDFNSRKVQPEYYSFVLRKTGLTPVQAENTCLLLDKNVYGKSFAAVGDKDRVTGEYNQSIGAYNSQMDEGLTKDNPMGATVNQNGYVDAQRGHYARWDAATAECLIRVAAYNKDKQISNSWLFGAIGDDRPAEVWKVAGETFTCNKDLFGFSLMKDTATAALIGVGGGTVLGTGIGAAVGAGVANKNAEDGEGCRNKAFRKEVLRTVKSSTNLVLLSRFLSKSITDSTADIDEKICSEILGLSDKYEAYNVMVEACEKANRMGEVSQTMIASISCPESKTLKQCVEEMVRKSGKFDEGEVAGRAAALTNCLLTSDMENGQYIINASGELCKEASEVLAKMGIGVTPLGNCSFKNIDLVSLDAEREDILCSSGTECKTMAETREDLNILANILPTIQLEAPKTESRGATIGKGAAIGAAVGAGAGGLATAITALVEHDNINCRVGDGLGQVGLNKSYSIDGLKDLYVKWNLNLPDTQVVGGSTTVHDLASWTEACKRYTDYSACRDAQFYYKNAAGALEWVYSACEFDIAGATCNPSATLIKSYDVK